MASMESLMYSMDPSLHSRLARDGGYGGGCGGFEVFAFLAFLLALLDLVLELGDMGDGARSYRSRRGLGEVVDCKKIIPNEALWATGKLSEGLLRALYEPTPTDAHNPAHTCSHAHICEAVVGVANSGWTGEVFAKMSGEWLDAWPGLEGQHLGKVTLEALHSRTCAPYLALNCTRIDLTLDPVTSDLLASHPLVAKLLNSDLPSEVA